MTEIEVSVFCYWNGCIKYGPDGVYDEGSTPKVIKVKRKTKLNILLDELYRITGLDIDNQRSKVKIFGRYPSVVRESIVKYLLLPVVNESSLETMLEVPSTHPSINSVELYLEVKPDRVTVLAACSSPLENPGSSLKRQRTQQPSCQRGANGYIDTNVTYRTVKLERDNRVEVQGVDNSNGWIEDEADADFGNGSTHGEGEMVDKNSGSVAVAQVVNLTGDNGNAHKDLNVSGLEAPSNACLNKGVGSSASKPRILSSLWLDDHELRVGLCFKDRDELKKAVDWCTIRGRQKCVVRESQKDEYMFECVRWKCNWSLRAARMKEHGLVEITKCSGPHTCCPIGPDNFNVELAAEEIECLITVQPTLTVDELRDWWFKKFGNMIQTSEMQKAKQKVIEKIYGDWDQSFRVLPKLMAALHSSNGLFVDWKYELFPNPEYASFHGVFWAFPQSIEGFQHCRPSIIVDTKDLDSKYPMILMIASGLDADNCFFPLAFAVTKEVSTDSWRWFLTGIREKVTQRKGLCLISSPNPDIRTVISEPGSLWQEPWAYHRFCLDSLSSQFDDVFLNYRLKSLVEKAGSASQKEEFDSHMETIKEENPEARRWLDRIPPHQWAFVHDGGRRYGIMEIDTYELFRICDSFESLGLPMTATLLLLFDKLRSFFNKGLCDSSGRLNHGDMYAKPVMDKLKKLMPASVTHIIMPLEKGSFQVTEPSKKDGWIVQLSECTCTCGKFQSKKIPCLHALAVCEKLKINPLQYVDDCYSLERLQKTYAATFNPVPEVSAWPEALGVPTFFPPPLPFPPPSPPKVAGKSQLKTTKKKK